MFPLSFLSFLFFKNSLHACNVQPSPNSLPPTFNVLPYQQQHFQSNFASFLKILNSPLHLIGAAYMHMGLESATGPWAAIMIPYCSCHLCDVPPLNPSAVKQTSQPLFSLPRSLSASVAETQETRT